MSTADVKKVARALLLQRSYAHFVKAFWHVVEPKKLVENWHIDLECADLQRNAQGDPDYRRLSIQQPPGTMKSTLCSVFYDPWIWLTNPGEKTLITSYDITLVTRDNMKSRRIVESEEYIELMTLLRGLDGKAPWTLAKDQNEKKYYENSEGGFRQCVSIGGGLTGKRGDKIIIDDPVKLTDLIKADPKRKVEILAEISQWFNNVLNSRFNDMNEARIILVMQRVHELDLAGELAKDPDFRTLCLPMSYDPKRADPRDPRREAGELLFPAKFSAETLAKMYAKMSPGQRLAQYEQLPVPAEGRLLREEHFRNKYKWMPGNWRSNPHLPEMRRVTLHFDFAQKAKQTSDPTCGLLLGEGPSGEIYVLDRIYGRFTVTDIDGRIPAFIDVHRPHWVTIEDTALGTHAIQLLTEKQNRKNIITIQQPKDGKYVRMAVQAPALNNGIVWWPSEECPWLEEFVLEALSFPDGLHDDQVDALSQGLQWIYDNPLDRQRIYRASFADGGYASSNPAEYLERVDAPPPVTEQVTVQALQEAAMAQLKAQMSAMLRPRR